jgi:uncharacterized protein
MTLDDVRRLIQFEKNVLHARGVTGLYVFGSVARGDTAETSDLDLMIDYDPGSGFNLFDLAALQNYLAERCGKVVDLVTRDSVHRRIRERVYKEAVRVL